MERSCKVYSTSHFQTLLMTSYILSNYWILQTTFLTITNTQYLTNELKPNREWHIRWVSLQSDLVSFMHEAICHLGSIIKKKIKWHDQFKKKCKCCRLLDHNTGIVWNITRAYTCWTSYYIYILRSIIQFLLHHFERFGNSHTQMAI